MHPGDRVELIEPDRVRRSTATAGVVVGVARDTRMIRVRRDGCKLAVGQGDVASCGRGHNPAGRDLGAGWKGVGTWPSARPSAARAGLAILF